jgi:hypothetical protein
MITLDEINAKFHSVKISNGTTDLDIDGSGFITANINGSVVVTATNLDIRDLAFATDKVDVSGSTIVTTPDAFDVWKSTAHSATDVVSEIAATPLTGRLSITIENTGADPVFIGEANTVTAATGFRLAGGASFSETMGAVANLWAICAAGKTANLRVVEFAA